jgi:hypothetical protein
MHRRVAAVVVACGLVAGAGAAAFGCSHSSSNPGGHAPLTTDQLQDPETCGECHATHYAQWAGSMHAYAADDPLFIAMNARGQRETGGALGQFCVQCHAPLAVKLGATKDGLNLASLDKKLKGITCYWCHSIDEIDGAHNNPAKLADDGVMRGEYHDPFPTGAHNATYSNLHDADQPDSAKTCGSCHDIENTNAVPLARTYLEWQGTIFAHPDPNLQLTCASCHMPGRDAPAASVPNAPMRRVHDHRMVGVDVAITKFAEADDQRAAVQAALDPTLVSRLCVSITAGNVVAEVTLDNAFAGHDWPSGAAYHRRAWIELVAYDSTGAEIFHTGAVPDDQSLATQITKDASIVHFGAQMYDGTGAPVEMLWPATKIDFGGNTPDTSFLLLPAVTNVPSDPAFVHAKNSDYTLPSDKEAVKVTAAVHIRPVDYDFVDDLIASGDLDPALRTKLDTFTLGGTQLTWTKDAPGLFHCVPRDP